ncbi:MAG: hypothetical protein U0359_38035 [Byssovorax sp.]
MAQALLIAMAVVLGAGCAWLSWAHVLRVGRATSGRASALAVALKRVPDAERVDELSRRADPGSWEHRFACEVGAAPTAAAKIVAVNDALGELDHLFQAGAGWPSAAIRIALFGGMLLAVSAWLDEHSLGAALGIALTGVLSAGACFEAKRSAERRVAAERKAIDDLVAVAVGSLDAGDEPMPPERRARRSARAAGRSPARATARK